MKEGQADWNHWTYCLLLATNSWTEVKMFYYAVLFISYLGLGLIGSAFCFDFSAMMIRLGFSELSATLAGL